MKATFILLLIIVLLYFMKVITFDLLRLQVELNRLVNWVSKTYPKVKNFLKNLFKKLFTKNPKTSGI